MFFRIQRRVQLWNACTHVRRRYVTHRAPVTHDGSEKHISDFRSDTVTKACPKMREAMATTRVGDDVCGEDPIVNELEKRVAELLGMEGAVFVASGTMGNLLAVGTHCGRGDEVICGNESHIYNLEQGGASAIFGVAYRPVAQERGMIDLSTITPKADDSHCSRTALLCLENTHGRHGGVALPVSYMQEAVATCRKHGIRLHVDGARLWNAAIALNVPLRELLAGVDSVSVCLSKGLGAPCGSLVAGNADFTRRARRLRKAVGGGMRQVGHLAAAGLVGLDRIDELRHDHALARKLATGLKDLGIDVCEPQTNMVYFNIPRAVEFCDQLEKYAVRMGTFSDVCVRAVTHRDVKDEDVECALRAIAKVRADW